MTTRRIERRWAVAYSGLAMVFIAQAIWAAADPAITNQFDICMPWSVAAFLIWIACATYKRSRTL